MTIQILGGGCSKCRQLEKNARQAVENLALQADFDKVTDPDTILDMGVMMTPALAIDGRVLSSGKLLDVAGLEKLIKKSE